MLVMIALVEQHEAGFGYPGVQRAHPPRHHPRSPAQVAPHLRGDHRTDQGHLGRAQKHGEPGGHHHCHAGSFLISPDAGICGFVGIAMLDFG